MTEFADRYWSSRDGLKLHYRDYPGPRGARHGDRPPVLCLPGLTRNARDFERLAERLAGEWRVLCPELRGRGESEAAREAADYTPLQYIEDLGLLLDELAIARFVGIGTSLGGLMILVMAMRAAMTGDAPRRIAGALLNDIGPVIEPAGLAKIRQYVGQGRSFPTWVHAARALEDVHGATFPDYQIGDWLSMAKRVMTLSGVGRIVFDYDMKLAEPMLAADPDAPQPDLWPGIAALQGVPMTLVRGELSTLLSEATLAQMALRLPQAEVVTIPRVGHAPTLDEPEAAAAIDRLLERVARG